MPKIQLSPKQNLALQLLNDPLVVELLFGGGAGGGKSLLVTLWMVIQCRMYPEITIGLARKEISKLGKTTVVTLLTKTHPLLGVTQADFKYTAFWKHEPWNLLRQWQLDHPFGSGAQAIRS